MSKDLWTIRDVMSWTRDRFARAGIDSARLDAEVLLAHALGCPRIMLYTDLERPLSAPERDRYRALVSARIQRRPVAHLIGEKEFWSRRLRIDPRVLVPRPETELLVEKTLEVLRGQVRPRVLDVGTGSGAIAIALASERPDATVVATDRSRAALELARENAEQHEVTVSFHAGDLLDALPQETAPFQAVVANLPYVDPAQRDTLAPELGHEPPEALFAEEQGLEQIRRLVASAPRRALAPGGWLLLEVGAGQAPAVADRMRAAGCADEPAVHPDLAGVERVVAARWVP
jgi:release factor glutamine methyltransferase